MCQTAGTRLCLKPLFLSWQHNLNTTEPGRESENYDPNIRATVKLWWATGLASLQRQGAVAATGPVRRPLPPGAVAGNWPGASAAAAGRCCWRLARRLGCCRRALWRATGQASRPRPGAVAATGQALRQRLSGAVAGDRPCALAAAAGR